MLAASGKTGRPDQGRSAHSRSLQSADVRDPSLSLRLG
jgi:hypothetical protein